LLIGGNGPLALGSAILRDGARLRHRVLPACVPLTLQISCQRRPITLKGDGGSLECRLCHLKGPLRVGSRARVKQPAQRAAVWTVTRLEPNELFEWEARVLGVHMVGRHRITPDGDRCRNTLQIDLSGRGSGVLGKLAGGRIRKAIATENEGFKRAAEAA
jgi:hypothetical protein